MNFPFSYPFSFIHALVGEFNICRGNYTAAAALNTFLFLNLSLQNPDQKSCAFHKGSLYTQLCKLVGLIQARPHCYAPYKMLTMLLIQSVTMEGFYDVMLCQQYSSNNFVSCYDYRPAPPAHYDGEVMIIIIVCLSSYYNDS